jgi:DNA-directed RNA polymerase subunit RPC12/RpoP
MGKCPNCGNSKMFLSTHKCVICGEKGCEKCMSLWMVIYQMEVLRCHSGECYLTLEKKLKEALPLPEIIGTDGETIGHNLWARACLSVLQELEPKLAKKFEKEHVYVHRTRGQVFGYDYIVDSTSDYKEHAYIKNGFISYARLVLANNLEKAGLPLLAADVYEVLKMYDKARELREKEKQVIVKRTDISVDLNKMIQQVREGGIVVVYRCPHCNAPLKIGKDASVESLRVCEHCGSEIEVMDLADFLRTALS